MTIRKRKPLLHSQIASALRERIAELQPRADGLAHSSHPQVRETWIRCHAEVETLRGVLNMIELRQRSLL